MKGGHKATENRKGRKNEEGGRGEIEKAKKQGRRWMREERNRKEEVNRMEIGNRYIGGKKK